MFNIETHASMHNSLSLNQLSRNVLNAHIWLQIFLKCKTLWNMHAQKCVINKMQCTENWLFHPLSMLTFSTAVAFEHLLVDILNSLLFIRDKNAKHFFGTSRDWLDKNNMKKENINIKSPVEFYWMPAGHKKCLPVTIQGIVLQHGL